MDFWDAVPLAWQNLLEPVRDQIQRISRQLVGQEYLPKPEQIFRALDLAPEAVQVLIVGQDPYPNPAHACGLSFSVPAGTAPLPGSMRNILKEVTADVGVSITNAGDLQAWSKQGVMLLNRVLTVAPGVPMSHHHLGWQKITDRIVQIVAQQSPAAIAILWGNQARELAHFFPSENVITGVHPSPLSAHRGFFGSRPFSKVNEKRRALGRQEISW